MSLPLDLEPPPARRELARGDFLFRTGDEAHALYAVERGRLRLERPLADGFVLTLHVAHPGQSFAEASLFSERFHCDAVAETASRVAVYPKSAVLAAFARDPDFARRFTALLADQVRALRALLEIRNVRGAEDRVLQYLHFRALTGDPAVDRPVRSIAAEVGLSQETVYRVLRRLQEQGGGPSAGSVPATGSPRRGGRWSASGARRGRAISAAAVPRDAPPASRRRRARAAG